MHIIDGCVYFGAASGCARMGCAGGALGGGTRSGGEGAFRYVSRRADVQQVVLDTETYASAAPSGIWRWGDLGPELQPLMPAQGWGIVHTIASADPPLPIWMIADMLGVPAAYRSLVRRYTDAFVSLVDPTSSADKTRQAIDVFTEGQRYLAGFISRCEQTPDDTMLSAVANAALMPLLFSQRQPGRLREPIRHCGFPLATRSLH